MKDINYDYVIEECCDLFYWCEGEEKIDFKKLKERWKKCFIDVCLLMGMNKKSAKILFKNLRFGNWKHWWKAGEEKDYSLKEWIEVFSYDLYYCCDRWSIDRLMRCHWKYRQIMRFKEGKKND